MTDISVSSANLVTLKLGKVTVVWGGASEPQLKVEVMTVLLGQKGVRTIDVSAPRTPVTAITRRHAVAEVERTHGRP